MDLGYLVTYLVDFIRSKMDLANLLGYRLEIIQSATDRLPHQVQRPGRDIVNQSFGSLYAFHQTTVGT